MKTIDYPYSIEWADRKTLAISVLPDCSIVVSAPFGTLKSEIEKRLMRRSNWIARQIRFFEAYNPRATPRHYVAGEGHLFLGKVYRLTLCQGPEAVQIQGDRLLVSTDDLSPISIMGILDTWYRSQARAVYPIIVTREWSRMGYRQSDKPRLIVRKLDRRWGSLSPSGILTLNTSIIKAPEICIEYVICHELCHAEVPDHSAEFYGKLSRYMPDWEARKSRLEMLLK